MYKTLLVPVDGSQLAEKAVPYAGELAGRLDLGVLVFHVCDRSHEDLVGMHQIYVEHVAEGVQQRAREIQRETGGLSTSRPAEVRGEVAMGHPAEEILCYAEENAVDLIMMSTHGRSGIMRWRMGSVADKVLRGSKVPVWLVRAGVSEENVPQVWPNQRILVPLDGSDLAETVLPHVQALANQRGIETMQVVLLTIVEPPAILTVYPVEGPLISYETIATIQEEAEEASKRYLANVQKQLEAVGISVSSEVLVGRPADKIVAYADSKGATLIVMATHGYSGISRWVYGSVAEKVLHGSSVPVLLVRPS